MSWLALVLVVARTASERAEGSRLAPTRVRYVMVFQQVASENNNNSSSNNPYISYSVTLCCSSSTRLFTYMYIHQCNNVHFGTAQQLQMNRTSWGKGRRGREGGDDDSEGDEEYRKEEKDYRSLQESYCGPREHRCQQRPHNDKLIVIILDYLLRVIL